MKRPEFVTIGPFTYEIYYSNEAVTEDMGKTDWVNRKITIWPSIDETVVKETLFHEIEHVVLEGVMEAVAACDLDIYRKEERLVRLTSPKFFQTFRDNPAVTKYLFG